MEEEFSRSILSAQNVLGICQILPLISKNLGLCTKNSNFLQFMDHDMRARDWVTRYPTIQRKLVKSSSTQLQRNSIASFSANSAPAHQLHAYKYTFIYIKRTESGYLRWWTMLAMYAEKPTFWKILSAQNVIAILLWDMK